MGVWLRQSIIMIIMDCGLLFNLNVSHSSITFTFRKKKERSILYHMAFVLFRLLRNAKYSHSCSVPFLSPSLFLQLFTHHFMHHHNPLIIGGYICTWHHLIGAMISSMNKRQIWPLTSDNQSPVIRKDSLGGLLSSLLLEKQGPSRSSCRLGSCIIMVVMKMKIIMVILIDD